MSELYRVGNHQPQNLYRGDAYIGVMFDPADAAMIRDALNAMEPEAEPETFKDGDGDIWVRRAGGKYSLQDSDVPMPLSDVRNFCGEWGGEG